MKKSTRERFKRNLLSYDDGLDLPKRMMGTKEVAVYLDVSTRTIYRMLELGEIVGKKIRGQWKFLPSEAKRLITP